MLDQRHKRRRARGGRYALEGRVRCRIPSSDTTSKLPNPLAGVVDHAEASDFVRLPLRRNTRNVTLPTVKMKPKSNLTTKMHCAVVSTAAVSVYVVVVVAVVVVVVVVVAAVAAAAADMFESRFVHQISVSCTMEMCHLQFHRSAQFCETIVDDSPNLAQFETTNRKNSIWSIQHRLGGSFSPVLLLAVSVESRNRVQQPRARLATVQLFDVHVNQVHQKQASVVVIFQTYRANPSRRVATVRVVDQQVTSTFFGTAQLLAAFGANKRTCVVVHPSMRAPSARAGEHG
ncbi:hypothetical protein T07_6438 [Trichinella nelsoni]|uniref:Uncharacterized protein n=1 Tax=Trichinella nelsoni TaxID=6336 RepID=A0A0V0RNG4_9BILA|nr:hypothetical protein T07_6438 [Trichinella nelsoni]